MTELLVKYDTLAASLEIIQQYLREASQFLRLLPTSNGRSGLGHLTEYLARQTAVLGSAPQNSL
jgi:geranylgeranyl pyrophosphate synthase